MIASRAVLVVLLSFTFVCPVPAEPPSDALEKRVGPGWAVWAYKSNPNPP